MPIREFAHDQAPAGPQHPARKLATTAGDIDTTGTRGRLDLRSITAQATYGNVTLVPS